MDNDVRRLTSLMDTRGGTSAERVADAQSELGVVLPEEYVAFLIETNGGAGPVGHNGWASFYSVNELVEMNAWYHDDPFEQFEGLTLFGSDGGGEAFCFDTDGAVVMAAYISGKEDNIPIGPFNEFLRRLATGLFDHVDSPDAAADGSSAIP